MRRVRSLRPRGATPRATGQRLQTQGQGLVGPRACRTGSLGSMGPVGSALGVRDGPETVRFTTAFRTGRRTFAGCESTCLTIVVAAVSEIQRSCSVCLEAGLGCPLLGSAASEGGLCSYTVNAVVYTRVQNGRVRGYVRSGVGGVADVRSGVGWVSDVRLQLRPITDVRWKLLRICRC